MNRMLLLAAPVLLISANLAQAQSLPTLPQAQAAVDSWYRQFLGRVPDPTAAVWVLALVNGRPPAYVLTDILASQEYFTRAGGTNAGFVSQLYQNQLGRAPTPAELVFWTNLLRHKSRKVVAFLFLASGGNIQAVAASRGNVTGSTQTKKHRHHRD